jgi:hypothetical protein
MKHLTATRRRWLYGMCLAALPLLIYFGLVEPEAAPLWLAFLVALLNVNDSEPDYSTRILGKAFVSTFQPKRDTNKEN